LEKQQVKELTERRADRDQQRVDEILKQLTTAAKEDDNLFPIILDAVKARTTIGEICTALATTFGRYRDQLAR